MTRSSILLGLSLSLLTPSACDHAHGDHDHDTVDSTALTKAACAQAGMGQVAVTASTDPMDSTATTIVANAAPRTVTLTAGVPNYVWLETEANHVDAAIFVSVAGAVSALLDVEGAPLSLFPEGAPADCNEVLAQDLRVHLDDQGVYRLELDGAATTEVELLFLDQASAHAHTE